MSRASLTPSDLEPLRRLARFTFDWAPALCDPAHGCTDYHRAWSTLRLLDLEGAIPAGWPFLQRELRALAGRDGHLRVLVSGAADTGLPAVVASALPADDTATLVLTDRCETTLAQNRLFARHLGRSFETHRCDAREIACDPVDAVVAHSFLIFFPPAMQAEVLAAWARVLKPGGLLLMSNRLARAPGERRAERDPSGVPARLDTLRERAPSLGWVGEDLDALLEVARQFWTRPPMQVLTEDGLRGMLDAAGFDLLRIDYDEGDAPTGPLSQTHAGPRRGRAEIVARRREG